MRLALILPLLLATAAIASDEFTLADHLRLAWPNRTFVAIGETITFDDEGPMPTEQELAATHDAAFAAWQSEQAANQAAANIPTLKAQMAAIFDAMPAQQRAGLYITRAAIALAIENGDLAAARTLIEDTEVPPELADEKIAILALLPES